MYYRNINMGTQRTGLSIHFMAMMTSYPTGILHLWFIMIVPEPWGVFMVFTIQQLYL